MDKINDFKASPELQSYSQRLSFGFKSIDIDETQHILSESTKSLIVASVSEGPTGDYLFSHENADKIYTAIHRDGLYRELATAASSTHRNEVLLLLGN